MLKETEEFYVYLIFYSSKRLLRKAFHLFGIGIFILRRKSIVNFYWFGLCSQSNDEFNENST